MGDRQPPARQAHRGLPPKDEDRADLQRCQEPFENVEKVMSKQREQLERTLALVLLAYGLGLMIGEGARDEAYYRGEGNQKGGSSHRRLEMEALLGAICAAKEATEVRDGSVASYPGTRIGAMEAKFVSAFLRKCLIYGGRSV